MPRVRRRRVTAAKPGPLHQRAEAVGPRETRHRPRQVGVRAAVAADQAPDARQDVLEVEPVEGARKPRRVAELEHHQPAAGTQHPAQLAERRGGIADVADAEGDQRAVEPRVADGQPLGVAGGHARARLQPAPGQLSRRAPEHLAGEVEPDAAVPAVAAAAPRRAGRRCRCTGRAAGAGRAAPGSPRAARRQRRSMPADSRWFSRS